MENEAVIEPEKTKTCNGQATGHGRAAAYKVFNPFASIVRTGTCKGKVKVSDICLNNSFLT